MKPSLRVYVVHHHEGLVTATLMRMRERPFAPAAPTAAAESSEEALRHVESVLRARLLERADVLADYLFEGEVRHHDVEIDVHPQRTVEKTPVIGDATLPLRLSYAVVELPRGGFRVMLPRFGWWFVCQTERAAAPLIRQLVSAELLGQSGHGLLHFRRGRSESVVERSPSWAVAPPAELTPDESDAEEFRELGKVAEEWVLRAKRRQLPTTVGELSPEHVGLVQARPLRSVVLVGPSGVGKTAWVRKVARHLSQRPKTEGRRRLWATSAERLVSGMRFLGEWQARALAVVSEAATEEDFVFVDHLSSFVREQPGGGSIADFFLPKIRDGILRIIAECDEREWQRAQSSHPDLCAELAVIHLTEPRTEEMPSLLRAFQERRAPHVALHVEGYRRLVSHLALAVRTTAFPGKGFRFLEQLVPDPDRAAPASLTPREVTEAFARVTGLPLALVSDDHVRTEASLAAQLAERVVGQDAACRTAASILTRFKAGLADEGRPLGVLLFVGPTGVGKTELAKQLAAVMLGDARRLVRLDMSEYQLPGASQRLIQAGGDGGYGLAARVRAQPLTVVLFDEIEKAHPEVFDLLLGVLGEGRLTDTDGRDVDFRSTVIVMTSNLGAGEGARLGFDAASAPVHVARVREHFRPELVARIDHVIPFGELSPRDARRIVDLMLEAVTARTGLSVRGLRLTVEARARDRLAALGYEPGKGARALARVIEEEIVARIGGEIARHPERRDVELAIDWDASGFSLALR